MKVKEIELLKVLLKQYLSEYDPKVDCHEKWMESVQDEVYDLLRDTE